MTKEELIAQEIDKYTDLMLILDSDENWKEEANRQLRKVRAKLESFGVAVDLLSSDNAGK